MHSSTQISNTQISNTQIPARKPGKQIRPSVFETNSSSSHSLCVSESNQLNDFIIPNQEGIIELTGGQFSWGPETYNDAITKTNYCAVHIQGYCSGEEKERKLNMLRDVILSQTMANDLVFGFSTDDRNDNYSYIDHQSVHDANVVFKNADTLRNFIFNKDSQLIIDNDNGTDYDYYDNYDDSE